MNAFPYVVMKYHVDSRALLKNEVAGINKLIMATSLILVVIINKRTSPLLLLLSPPDRRHRRVIRFFL